MNVYQQARLSNQIKDYFDEVNFPEWSIIGYLYSIRNSIFTSTNANEVAVIMKEIINNYGKLTSFLVNAWRKLEQLVKNFESIWNRPEIQQYFDKLDFNYNKNEY
ncbi:hypothetical protein G9A89_016279 [Geosiphon pyriformis]|nr:hypothetical protein G9A89_016279 [Geosiphon pyriformis]